MSGKPFPKRNIMDAAPTTVRDAFERFVDASYTDGRPSKQQLIELRRAFFGGHYAAVFTISDLADDASGEEHEQRVMDLLKEVKAFVDIVGTPAEEAL